MVFLRTYESFFPSLVWCFNAGFSGDVVWCFMKVMVGSTWGWDKSVFGTIRGRDKDNYIINITLISALL